MEETPSPELAAILDAASEFANYPGFQNDASVQDFLDRFPLPVILGVLQTQSSSPRITDTIVPCLHRIFRTKFGASLLSDYALFIEAGLQADSHPIRCLACRAFPVVFPGTGYGQRSCCTLSRLSLVSYLLENANDKRAALEILTGYQIYPLLISCLIDGDQQSSTASIDAIAAIAQLPEGISLMFPAQGGEPVQLRSLATNSSSLARIRILSLIVKLFSLSEIAATSIFHSNLLGLFEVELGNGNDMLTTLSALELLYELVQSPYSTMLVLKTHLLQLLTNMIRDSSADQVLRSRAALIGGRLLSSAEAYEAIDLSCVTSLLLALDERMKLIGDQNTDEYENALEALGLIGASIQGASLLLVSFYAVATHVVESAFNPQSRGKQLAGLLALSSIVGIDRSEHSRVLDDNAEECLKHLIYTAACNSTKLNPSGLFLSVLQQDPEVRLAGYRLISALVSRKWCLVEVCSKREIIDIVTDAKMESTKYGMEARHDCCTLINKALSASNLLNVADVSGIAAKLQEAIKRGPYLAREFVEPQPAVKTAERF